MITRPAAIRSLLVALTIASAAVLGLTSAQPARAASVDLNVQVVNLSDQSFAVAWETAAKTTGSMEYGPTCATATTVVAEETSDGTVHLADVADTSASLNAGTLYYYQLIDGGVVDNNGGACYTATTFATQGFPPPPATVTGTVKTPACLTGASGSLVLLSVTDGGTPSTLLATITTNDTTSGWSIAVGAATDGSGNFLNPRRNDPMNIDAISAPLERASMNTTYQPGTGGAPQSAGSICDNVVTAAYVHRFTWRRAGRDVIFHWQVGPRGGVAGFNLFAGKRRLNPRLIQEHAGRTYEYRAHLAASARFVHRGYTLEVVFRDGRRLRVK